MLLSALLFLGNVLFWMCYANVCKDEVLERNKFHITMKDIINIEDFGAVLDHYKGAYTQIWLYNVSLKRIILRLTNGNGNALYIVGVTCKQTYCCIFFMEYYMYVYL